MVNVIKKISNETIYKILVIIIFVVIAIITGQHHEHWIDEAQAFLIARDSSSPAEILYYTKFEGTLPLWVFLIKLFLLCGGTYKSYYILPIIFSVVGLILLEFKVKAPMYLKILFPFTYFLFYQYTIVARSYCMVFPALMLICSCYDKRFEKPVLYYIAIFWLSSICSYTLVLASSLLIIDIVKLLEIFIKENNHSKAFKESLKAFENHLKINKKKIIFLMIIGFTLLVNLCLLIPDKECNFEGNGGRQLYVLLYHATVGNRHIDQCTIPAVIVSHIFILILIIAYLKEENGKSKAFYSCLFIYPILLENMTIHSSMWHIGMIWFGITALFIINNMINTNKIVQYLIIFICMIQIIQSFLTIKYDINEKYDAGQDVANYLKSEDYKNKTIYGVGYDVVSILPYFEENIFSNLNQDKKSIWLWKDNNGYMTNNEMIENLADIYVFDAFHFHSNKDLYTLLREKGYGAKRVFYGNMYTKAHINEPKSFIIVKKLNSN